MAARATHKDAIVAAAAALFRRHGYAATGLADILASSGAPKGSLYHYFPGGKAAVGVAAVELAGGLVTSLLEETARTAAGPGDLLRRYADAVAEGMSATGWIAGCPIATTLLEVAPADEAITAAGGAVLANWQAVFERSAAASGIAEAQAKALASLAIAAIEGALLQARVQMSKVPLVTACGLVADLFDQAAARRPR